MSIKLEHIDHMSATELLRLSDKELDQLITKAEAALEKAQTRVYWLGGIKIEKHFREKGDMEC